MTDKQGFIPQKNRNDLTAHFAKVVGNKKVSVAIDAANLYYASSVSKIKIDYFQVANWFKENCASVNLNFYTAFDPEDAKQLEFFQGLEAAGYNVVKKAIKVFEDSKKGNMDIELAVDAIVQQDSYEILILLSGDGDFTYLISALEKLGKQTIILGIGGFTSYELHQEAGRYFFLNRISHVWRKFSSKTPELTLPIDKTEQEEGVIILENLNQAKSSYNQFAGFENIPAKLEKTKKNKDGEIIANFPQPEQITAKPRTASKPKVKEEITPKEITSASKTLKNNSPRQPRILKKNETLNPALSPNIKSLNNREVVEEKKSGEIKIPNIARINAENRVVRKSQNFSKEAQNPITPKVIVKVKPPQATKTKPNKQADSGNKTPNSSPNQPKYPSPARPANQPRIILD